MTITIKNDDLRRSGLSGEDNGLSEHLETVPHSEPCHPDVGCAQHETDQSQGPYDADGEHAARSHAG